MNFGVELVAEAAEDVLGHPRERQRGDGVRLDVVLGALDGEHPGEPDEAHLRRAVVGLAEVAEDAGRRAGRHHASVSLLAHAQPRRLGDVEGALQVHVDHRVDQVGCHVGERPVAQDAGVVDDDVDAPEGVDGRLHDRLAALDRGDRVGVGDGHPAGGGDLLDDRLCRAGARAGAVDGAAEVVHHHQRPAGGQQQGVLATQPAAGAGDDRYLAVETEFSHPQEGSGRVRPLTRRTSGHAPAGRGSRACRWAPARSSRP